MNQGSPKCLGEDHISYCKIVRGPDILRNVIFSGHVPFYQINRFFVSILFFHYSQNALRPGVKWLHRSDLAREPLCKEPWYRLKSGDSTHHFRSPTPKLNGCDLLPSTRTQFSEQEYSYLTASKTHQSTPYSHNIHRTFNEEPPEVDKTCLYFFGMLLGFLENLLKSGNLFCSATAATKTALGIIQLWINYFRGIMACPLSGRLSKEIPR